MRLRLLGLLILGLAACDDAPAPQKKAPPTAVVSEEPALQASADPAGDYHVLRQGWLEMLPATSSNQPAERAPESLVADPRLELNSHSGPVVGIIIDDVGHNLRQGRRIIALPAPVALAILPHTLAAERLATEAQSAGKTVLLHQPMENTAGLSIGPGGLYTSMQQPAFEHQLQDNLNSLLPLQGVNNHMGSRLTAQRDAMDWTMAVLRERGLFFLDSRTTADTQAAFAAEAAGVRHLSRDVFLDNQRTVEAIDAQFRQALRLARQQGMAVMIGHPYPQTLDYLEKRLPQLAQEGTVQVVSIEDLLARKYRSR